MRLPRRSVPQISGLIAFASTARHLSFSRAAEDLALSQGAVSKRVRQLEDQLGVVLISRGGHQVQLTRFGRHFLPRVQNILSQIDRSTRDLLTEAGRVRSVTVKADPAFAIGWLLPRLADFSRTWPDIQVNLQTIGTSQPAVGEPDIVVRVAPPGAAAGGEQVLFRDTLIAVVGRQAGSGRSDADLLASRPRLRLADAWDTWDDWLAAAGRQADPVEGPVYDHYSLLIAAVKNGGGIALLPRPIAQDDLQSGRLRQIGAERPMAGAYLMSIEPGSCGIAEVERLGEWLMRASPRVAELHPSSGCVTGEPDRQKHPA